MFLPPVLRPLAAVGPVNAAVQRIAEAPFSVVRGAPGSYVAERLAGVIDSWERLPDCVWLRARRPSTGGTGAVPRRGVPASLVIRGGHRRPDRSWTTAQRGDPGGPRRRRHRDRARRPGDHRGHPAGQERPGPPSPIGESAWWRSPRVGSIRRSAARLTGWHRRPTFSTLTLLTGTRASGTGLGCSGAWAPRAAVVDDVLAAGQLWSQDVVAEALDASHGLPSFLDRLTAMLLDQVTPDQWSALEVASVTGYWHPQLGTRPVAAEQLRPWLVPLERQWGWLRPIWASALRRELARSVRFRRLGPPRRPTRPQRRRVPCPPCPDGSAARACFRRGCSAPSRCAWMARSSPPGMASGARACCATCSPGGSTPAPGTNCLRSTGPTSRSVRRP